MAIQDQNTNVFHLPSSVAGLQELELAGAEP